jgi:hypothetical protein
MSMSLPPSSSTPAPDLSPEIMAHLLRYVSLPTAQSVINLAKVRAHVSSARIDKENLREMLDAIEHCLALFVVDRVLAGECGRALSELASRGVAVPSARAGDARRASTRRRAASP